MRSRKHLYQRENRIWGLQAVSVFPLNLSFSSGENDRLRGRSNRISENDRSSRWFSIPHGFLIHLRRTIVHRSETCLHEHRQRIERVHLR